MADDDLAECDDEIGEDEIGEDEDVVEGFVDTSGVDVLIAEAVAGDAPEVVGDEVFEHRPDSAGVVGAGVAAVGQADEDPIVVLERQRDEYLEALRRLQADFENYRKRVGRTQADEAARATERLVQGLLPSLDAFEMAETHKSPGPDDEQSSGDSASGVLQAVVLLRESLAKSGLERMGEVGDEFDPNAHEAVEQLESDDDSGPVLAKVLRSGYRWKGRVIRPAMVSVRG